MSIKQIIGKTGENLATKYLKKINYKILERNFRYRKEEIDIIAYDIKQNEIVFIEVKTRTSMKYGRPCEAVKGDKQKHIKRVAQYYTLKHKIRRQAARFDVIEILLNNNTYKIEHIKQAFI